jgi:hypothetical protein
MKKQILILAFILAVPLMKGSAQETDLIPQSMCQLLRELSIPNPDQTSIKNAQENDPISFFNYLTKNFAPEYIQNINPFVNRNKDIVKTLLQRLFVYKNKTPSPKYAAQRIRYEIIADKYGFGLYRPGYSVRRANQGWIVISGTPIESSKKLWNYGFYSSDKG